MIDNHPDIYYSSIRYDIEPYIPSTASHLLSIGSGAGQSERYFKDKFGIQEVVAIEKEGGLLADLQKNVDQAIIADLDTSGIPFTDHYFDCILALDVLEHLVSPDRVFLELRRVLNPNGTLIVSLPNIQHYEMILRLMAGDWAPRKAGILDFSHLHFYTHRTILSLFGENGFAIQDIHRNYYNFYVYPAQNWLLRKIQNGLALVGQKAGFVKFIEAMPIRNLFAYQFIVVAKKTILRPIIPKQRLTIHMTSSLDPMPGSKCLLCGSSLYSVRCHLDGYEIRQCHECGYGYTWPPVQQNRIDEVNQSIYTIEHRIETYGSQKAELEARYQRRLSEISNLLGRETGKLLDVGCSIGFFLLTARVMGWQVKGVEMNAETSGYARDAFHLDVTTGTLEEANFTEEEFDVITAWDVIEHVPDPVGLLKTARRFLRADGVLAMQVPNMDSVMAQYTGPRWYWWSVPDHLSHFVPQSLKKILDLSGFELDTLYTWDSPKTVPMNILTAIMQVDLDGPPGRWAHARRKFAMLLAQFIAPAVTLIEKNWWKRHQGSLAVVLARKKSFV